MSIIRKFILFVISLQLTACNFFGGPSVSEIKAYIENEKSKTNTDIDHIPPILEYPIFHYTQASVSPFQPQISNNIKSKNKLSELPSDEINRKREELEMYDLFELQPVGLIFQKTPRAILLLPQNKENVLKCFSDNKELGCSDFKDGHGKKNIKSATRLKSLNIGDRIGRNFGKIIDINIKDKRVSILERLPVSANSNQFREEIVVICWPSREQDKMDGSCYNINNIERDILK